MLLDNADAELLKFVVGESIKELGKRLPIHSVHRWWSRRFSAVYRFILASYIFDDSRLVKEAVRRPELMRRYSRGKVFFEPFAGGGTGLVEAALAGWDVYGVDVNPVAVQAVKAGLKLVGEGLPAGFEERAVRILDTVFEKVGKYWVYGSMVAVYTFISRGRVPTWLSTMRVKGGKRVIAICPRCFRISELDLLESEGIVKCKYCDMEFSLTMKPAIPIPEEFPEVSNGWRAFAVEFRDLKKGSRVYASLRSRELSEWLTNVVGEAREEAKILCEVLGEEISDDMMEGARLRRAGIKNLCELFSPRQLSAFKAYIDTVKTETREDERLLYAIALSEATKTCSLLAKWYPPIGEPVPAGGMKALWVPEYSVEVNPLAREPGSLRNLGRRVLSSTLKAQLSAQSYITEHGGPCKVKSTMLLGDSSTHYTPFPPHIDLAVIDPPYGTVKSYASLAITHYASLKLFEALTGDNLTHGIRLENIAVSELVPDNEKSYERLRIVFEKTAQAMNENSRAVLMYNNYHPDNWLLVLKAIVNSGLTPTAIYWVLGETPGGLARSKIRGMYLVVLKKGQKSHETINIIFEDVMLSVGANLSLDIEAEKQTFSFLMKALERIDDQL